MKELKVIDISKYQGAVDFRKVKADGIDAVIIRCGYTGYGKQKKKNIDSRFESNYSAAKAAGLPVGVYYYSCAVNEKEAKEEAEFVLGLLKSKTLEYPVYWDTEDNHDTKVYAPESQLSVGKARLTQAGLAFLSEIRKAGLLCGVYASTSWLNNQLDMSRFSGYEVWVAQYASKVTYSGDYGMWQYTSNGKVNGISTSVDLNRCYRDYSKKPATDELKKGDKGNMVLALNLLLNCAKELGIINSAADITDTFTERTEKALREIQQSAGLKITGTAGSDEFTAIGSAVIKAGTALKTKIAKAVEVLK